MNDGGNVVPRITKAEHISPDDTGDNIHAKRVAPYYWDGSAWQRQPFASGLVTAAWDYVSVSYPTTSSEVYVFKSGGSGGATVGTVTVVYTDDTKADLSSAART